MPEIPKQELYGEFQRSQRWRDSLARKLSHKALDIGDDDMQLNVDNRRHAGFGWKEMAVVGALALAGFWLFGQGGQSGTPPASPSDSEYDVRFYDAQGKLIDVRPLSERPAGGAPRQ